VTFQEVVRRITGTSQGLWGLVVGSATGVKAEDGGRRVYSTDIDSNPWFEASLANEGMLWFPDLLVPDPTGILPYVVSAVMMTNIALTNNTPHVHESQSKLQGRLKICMMVFAGMMGPLLQGMPASMLLYFVSSTGSALLWNVLYMDRKYPLVKGLKPCKRPLVDVPAPSELVKR
jgi:inner membrane protein COX18